MRECFYDVNKLLEPVLANAKTGKHCGSTAVVCFIQDRKIYVANVGDSRAVLSRNGKPIRLSFDHKPYSQEEEDRVRSFGLYSKPYREEFFVLKFLRRLYHGRNRAC